MRQILCFGDSNTFGHIPGQGSRYPYEVRWTGVLQERLGPAWRVLEAGYNGRTTVFEDPFTPGRRGLDALPLWLESQRPLDLVILMLGTNDLKTFYGASAAVIARGVDVLAGTVQTFDYGGFAVPKLLLVSPPHLHENIADGRDPAFDTKSVRRSHQLAACYQAVARAHGCAFFDAAAVAQPSETDGVHMEPSGHRALAEALNAQVKALFD